MIYLFVYIHIHIHLSIYNAQWMLVPFIFSYLPLSKSWLAFKDLLKSLPILRSLLFKVLVQNTCFFLPLLPVLFSWPGLVGKSLSFGVREA